MNATELITKEHDDWVDVKLIFKETLSPEDFKLLQKHFISGRKIEVDIMSIIREMNKEDRSSILDLMDENHIIDITKLKK